MTFDLRVKVTQNVVQYLLHHVTYLGTKFEVGLSNRLVLFDLILYVPSTIFPNRLGGDIFTRNVMDRRMHGQTDDGHTLV